MRLSEDRKECFFDIGLVVVGRNDNGHQRRGGTHRFILSKAKMPRNRDGIVKIWYSFVPYVDSGKRY